MDTNYFSRGSLLNCIPCHEVKILILPSYAFISTSTYTYLIIHSKNQWINNLSSIKIPKSIHGNKKSTRGETPPKPSTATPLYNRTALKITYLESIPVLAYNRMDEKTGLSNAKIRHNLTKHSYVHNIHDAFLLICQMQMRTLLLLFRSFHNLFLPEERLYYK